MIRVSALYRYPIKSCRGEVLTRDMNFDRFGPTQDRRWVIADLDGNAITQRECPALTSLQVVSFADTVIRLTWTGPSLKSQIMVYRQEHAPLTSVRLWGDVCPALPAAPAIQLWLSLRLNSHYRLLHTSPDFARLSRGTRNIGDIAVHVGFADGYPLLITTESSLAELNTRLVNPVTMDHFRPNIVFSGTQPFDEDGWEGRRAKIGRDAIIRFAKPCARCVIVNTDQQTGKRTKEPLKTLATFRDIDNKIRFGMNADHLTLSRIHLGDKVELLD